MRSDSRSADDQSSAARTIRTSPDADGLERKTSSPAMKSWQQPRPCEWCGERFTVRYVQMAKARFCGTSCSAKWRMSRPEHKAKVHTPEVARKRGEKRRAWLASGHPKALAEIERIRSLNPATHPDVRAKISRALKAIHHGPSERGGNGRGLTEPQRILLAALGNGWIPELALSLGRRTPGYPTHYKLDLANPERRIAIEVDGFSHSGRRALDEKKDAKLASLGWTVLRFSNRDILTWSASGMPMGSSISTTLERHDIRPSP
jgi:hypothetical protein